MPDADTPSRPWHSVPNWPDDFPSTTSSRADERSVIRRLPHPYNMMVMASGRERTSAEYAELLLASGWRYDRTLHAPGALHSIVAATAA